MTKAKDQFAALVQEQAQAARVIEARAKLQNCLMVIQETNASVQAIVSEGALDLVAVDLKTGLNKIWAELKKCQTAIEALAEKDVLEL